MAAWAYLHCGRSEPIERLHRELYSVDEPASEIRNQIARILELSLSCMEPITSSGYRDAIPIQAARSQSHQVAMGMPSRRLVSLMLHHELYSVDEQATP